MTALEIILGDIDKRIKFIEDRLGQGSAATYEEYKSLCGEVKGLRTAEGYIKDLQHTMEHADE